MGRADLHVHTRVSDGMATVEQVLEHAERLGDLDLIAVTDHEDAAGGLRGRELVAQRAYRLDVVPGAEVTTLQGHLLALFVERCPRSFRSIERTLDDIHSQGGLAVIPHPMSWLTRSLSQRTIERILTLAEPGITFDAIETHNPSPAGRQTADKTAWLNERWRLPATGGSDAHHLPHLGSGWTEFPGATAAELRLALEQGNVRPGMHGYASLREVGVRQTILGLAWGYTATPRKMMRRGPHTMGRRL
ncbi:MAG: CehA/McbA family metallohydrolase [Dehalococcoidia bacterium]